MEANEVVISSFRIPGDTSWLFQIPHSTKALCDGTYGLVLADCMSGKIEKHLKGMRGPSIAISASGRFIAISKGTPSGNGKLFILNSSGETIFSKAFRKPLAAPTVNPQFSADERLLVFPLGDSVYTVNLDCFSLQEIFHTDMQEGDVRTICVSDDDRLAVVTRDSAAGCNYQLITMKCSVSDCPFTGAYPLAELLQDPNLLNPHASFQLINGGLCQYLLASCNGNHALYRIRMGDEIQAERLYTQTGDIRIPAVIDFQRQRLAYAYTPKQAPGSRSASQMVVCAAIGDQIEITEKKYPFVWSLSWMQGDDQSSDMIVFQYNLMITQWSVFDQDS